MKVNGRPRSFGPARFSPTMTLDTEEHEKPLYAVLTHFKELNLTLKKEKRQFYMPHIELFGMVFSADGMSPNPAKVEAIKQAQAPTSVSDVRSLLGMCLVSYEIMQILWLLCTTLLKTVFNSNRKMFTNQR